MNQVFKEGNLQLDFSKAQKVEKFDNPKTHQAPDFKKVDFLVEQNNDLFLIEVKGGKPKNIKKEETNLSFKAKDSLLYLFLMDRYDDNQRNKYLVISDKISDPATLTRMSDRLKQQLGITNPPWSNRPYFITALAFNTITWNRSFPEFPVSRIAAN
jgi:hypothetical protein